MPSKLFILLLTYTDYPDGPRAQYAKETIKSTLNNVKYSGQISVHIADNSPLQLAQYHTQQLIDLVGGYKTVQGISWSKSNNHSYGRSYNLATQRFHEFATSDDAVLVLEDDWRLAHPLNLDEYVAEAVRDEACVRLGYIGFTQELRGTLVNRWDKVYLEFDPYSPEPHVSSGHPRIESVTRQKSIGPWVEGTDPGSTEMEWCGRYEARARVLWPMDTPVGGFYHHIGTVQARRDQ